MKGTKSQRQALFEQQQAPYAAVAALKGVNALELVMEIQQIVEGLFLLCVVVLHQRFIATGASSGAVVALPPTSFGNAYSLPRQTTPCGCPWCRSSAQRGAA